VKVGKKRTPLIVEAEGDCSPTGAVPLSQKFFKHRSHFAQGIMRYDRSAHDVGYVIYNTQ